MQNISMHQFQQLYLELDTHDDDTNLWPGSEIFTRVEKEIRTMPSDSFHACHRKSESFDFTIIDNIVDCNSQ